MATGADDSRTPNLIILGASARAAAASAIRAGLTPWTADLFADVDLKAMVPDAIRCPVGQYPHGFEEILKDAPEAPWMYTGALENHPDLIGRLAEIRPLWGNGPIALVTSRSPFHLARLLLDANLPALEVRAFDADLPTDFRWLRKPLRGSAGQGISFESARGPTHYFQQFVEGIPMSAVFVRAHYVVKLLGVTEQLIGTEWLNAPPFRYAGNTGPVAISESLQEHLSQIGTTIGGGCDLMGLFGVDFILADDRPWVVEVNPRYTASVEILEFASALSIVKWHANAFDENAPGSEQSACAVPAVGKGIIYSDRELIVPAGDWLRGIEPEMLADVPHGGEAIPGGWPVLTIFSKQVNRAACRTELKRLAADVLCRLVAT